MSMPAAQFHFIQQQQMFAAAAAQAAMDDQAMTEAAFMLLLDVSPGMVTDMNGTSGSPGRAVGRASPDDRSGFDQWRRR